MILRKPGVLYRMALALALLLPVSATLFSPSAASAASCNTTAVGNWANNCTVSEGADSQYVVAIQIITFFWLDSNFNDCQPPLPHTIDGDFGPTTLGMVKCFQHHSGLTADGIVGPKTWAALASHLYWSHNSGGWAYYGCTDCMYNGVTYLPFQQWINTSKWYVDNAVMNTGPPHL